MSGNLRRKIKIPAAAKAKNNQTSIPVKNKSLANVPSNINTEAHAALMIFARCGVQQIFYSNAQTLLRCKRS